MNMNEKVVIITGASSGIGEATAYRLAKEGARLVLGARRQERLQAIVDKVKELGGQAVYRVTDVVRREDNQALVDLALERFGRVDVIFLNAGLMPNSPLSALEQDNWDQMIDVNIKGVTNGIAAVLPTFIQQKGGQVIATSSVAGQKVYPGGAVYCGSKWAVRAIMEALRMESAQEGTNIRTTTIYPAAVQSELVDSITFADSKAGYRQLYDTYEISPDRVADLVAFAINTPADTTISDLVMGPSKQPW